MEGAAGAGAGLLAQAPRSAAANRGRPVRASMRKGRAVEWFIDNVWPLAESQKKKEMPTVVARYSSVRWSETKAA